MTTTGHDPSTGELPYRWGLFPLADLLAVSIGGVWGSEEGESEVDVNVIRVTELKPHGVIDPSTAARRSITRKQLVSRRLSEGDLLLEKSGGGPKTPVGRVGMVPSLDADSVCANFMLLMRVNPDLVNCRLLHLFLNFFHSGGGTVEFQTATTNIRNIKTADYLQVPIPVPLLAEQARIVEILEGHLSRLDAALQHIQTLRDKAAQFRRSLLHAAFTGALTGHDPSTGELPDRWESRSLGEVAKWGSRLLRGADPLGRTRLWSATAHSTIPVRVGCSRCMEDRSAGLASLDLK